MVLVHALSRLPPATLLAGPALLRSVSSRSPGLRSRYRRTARASLPATLRHSLHDRLAGGHQADMAVTPVALPPGVMSVHVLPSDHHDGPWDHIVTPPGVERDWTSSSDLSGPMSGNSRVP